MKQVTVTQLKRMTAGGIKAKGCFELVADGEPVAIVVVGAEQEMRQRIIAAASQINAARGK